MYDLVCVGDTTLDTFLKIHDASLHCDLKTHDCELCFRYGEKIAVEEVLQNPGGNAANVAVGAATLGVKTALYAIVGNDDIGEKAKRMIAKRGVDTKFLFTNKGSGTNYSTIISYKGERTILEMKYPARLSFAKFPKTQWVYLSSIKQDPKTVYDSLVRLKKKFGFKIAFNPGMYQLSQASDPLVKLLPHVDVLIINKEEAESLCKIIPQFKIINKNTTHYLLSTINSITHGLVFVTEGEQGAYGYDGKLFVHCDPFPAKTVLDRTGAGDAFSSGIMAGIINNVRFPEVIRWGMANAAAVLRRVGPQNGLLQKTEIRHILAKANIFPHVLTKRS